MQVSLVRTESANPAGTAKTFWFKPEKSLRYTAGQFIELYLPHKQPDERGIKHWFTLSSSPTDELISITTKLDPVHSSTFKQALAALQPGAVVTMSEPMGDFVLPQDTAIPLIFVAGGIGVTPIHSMIKWLHDKQQVRNISLLYAVNQPEELAFEELFRSTPGVTLIPIYTQPPAGWQGLSGRLTAEIILSYVQPGSNPLIYVSGPEPMTEALEASLLASGVSSDRLVLDFFPGYSY